MYNIVTKISRRFYFVLLAMGMLWGMMSPKVFAQEVGVLILLVRWLTNMVIRFRM